MELYFKKRRWKIVLLLVAILIGATSLIYTNWLIRQMSIQERKSVELWASAEKRLVDMSETSNEDITFLQQIIENNTTIPIILTQGKDSIMGDRNIAYKEKNKDVVLRRELKKMKAQKQPIEIILSKETKQYLFYRDSNLLQNLRYFPLVQFSVIMLFILVAYMAFSSSRKAQQNQVWVGLSKETAHQLGTPISSIMAWMEMLKLKNTDPALIGEFEKDVLRLNKIAERFSKIGSRPKLIHQNLIEVVQNAMNYLKTRISNKIELCFSAGNEATIIVPLNAPLFEWVIENVCKNAMDAIGGKGKIDVGIHDNANFVFIDIKDTGKGIAKSRFKTIFKPGFTTKERGWGLGLSLTKRIIEEYHGGKIFVAGSELGKGTTIRIILNKQNGKFQSKGALPVNKK